MKAGSLTSGVEAERPPKSAAGLPNDLYKPVVDEQKRSSVPNVGHAMKGRSSLYSSLQKAAGGGQGGKGKLNWGMIAVGAAE